MRQQDELYDLIETTFIQERPRIVGLCGYLSGDRTVAEDLAQETYMEAWRHIVRIDDPGGIDRWLSAIARNICLRWRSRQVREVKRTRLTPDHASGQEQSTVGFQSPDSLDFDLERGELASLLDQALSYLPDTTRRALLARYVEESPYAKIAAQLQLSEGAVKMRVKRGRSVLARVLNEDFRQGSSQIIPRYCSHGGSWESTELWCSICGQQKLEGSFDSIDGDLVLKCSTCFPTLGIHESQTYGAPDLFQHMDTIEDAYNRLIDRAGGYLWSSLRRRKAICIQCGKDASVIRQIPDDGPLRIYDWRGVQIRCETCGHISWGSLNGLLMSRPEIQCFRQDHPRIRMLPERRIESNGQPALAICFESLTSEQQVTAVVARDTFRILEVDVASM